MSSAPPYTIRTGSDDNGDLVFNDRPLGVGRNTERGSRQINGNANASYTISFGKRKVQAPPGISVIGGPAGVVSVNAVGGGEQPRYRISFNVGVQNFANRVNRNRLQRHDDLTLLPPANQRRSAEEDRHGRIVSRSDACRYQLPTPKSPHQ